MRDAAIDPLRQPGRGAARPRTAGAPPLDGVLDDGMGPRGQKGSARQGRATSAAIAAQRLGGGRNVALSVAQARRRAAPGLLSRLRARLPRIRPLRALAVAAFGIALVGIVANAMVFQHGRHPAPLFGLGRSIDGQPEVGQQAAAPSLPAPVPVSPPVERTGSTTPPAPSPAAVEPDPVAVAPKPVPAAPVHRAAAPKARHEEARHEDGIGAMLAAKPAAHPRPGQAVKAAAKPAAKPGTASGAAVGRKAEPKPEHKGETAKASPAAAAQTPADRRAATDAAAMLAPARPRAAATHPRPHAKPAPSDARAEPAAKKAAAAE